MRLTVGLRTDLISILLVQGLNLMLDVVKVLVGAMPPTPEKIVTARCLSLWISRRRRQR